VGGVTERRLLLVNGPNLNLLGTREPALYGSETLDDVVELVMYTADEFGYAVRAVQSNHEGVLIDAIHAARTECGAIVINPAGLTHTSVALRDALAAVALPTVELHITNVHRREEFRHHSHISAVADAVIVGAGTHGYVLATLHAAHLLSRLSR
jgi:3-dehydroquinate dehydratase-2